MSGFDWSKAPKWATAVGKKEPGGSYAWLCDAGYCFQGIRNPPCHPYKGYKREDFVIVAHRHAPAVITLTPAEVSSGYDRVQWAEGLIRQLPEDHEGRNSWLMNYGDPVKRAADVPEWSGEGLPPEKSQVEIKRGKDWTKAWVIGFWRGSVVIGYEDEFGERVELRIGAELRPIRTAEQIAVAAQEAAVSDLADTLSRTAYGQTPRDYARAAVLAGYRKP